MRLIDLEGFPPHRESVFSCHELPGFPSVSAQKHCPYWSCFTWIALR